jgi:hypothetical protein
MAYDPKTAEDVVAEYPQDTVSAAAAEAADSANVRRPEYINYDAALANYEARSDVETLAHRRAREAGDQFSDTDFVRAEGYDGN